MEAILIALATAFNALVIKWKIEHNRFEDATLDVLILISLAALFGGTMGGMIIATISSFIVSIYLLFSPPKLTSSSKVKDFMTEFKSRMPQ